MKNRQHVARQRYDLRQGKGISSVRWISLSIFSLALSTLVSIALVFVIRTYSGSSPIFTASRLLLEGIACVLYPFVCWRGWNKHEWLVIRSLPRRFFRSSDEESASHHTCIVTGLNIFHSLLPMSTYGFIYTMSINTILIVFLLGGIIPLSPDTFTQDLFGFTFILTVVQMGIALVCFIALSLTNTIQRSK